MKSLFLLGRRWRDSNGTTYHTVEIHADGCPVHKSRSTYGYGKQYEDTAAEWLYSQKLLKARVDGDTNASRYKPLWRVCEDDGITFNSEAVDVPRKSDL